MITEDEIRTLHSWLPPAQFEALVKTLRRRGTLEEITPEEVAEIERWNARRDPNRPKRRLYWSDYPQDEISEDYGEARKEHAFLLRCDGLTYREIGQRIGVVTQTARALANRHCRRVVRVLRKTLWTWEPSGPAAP